MQKFIIAIVIIGVVLVIGIFISASIQDATREAASATVNNETLTSVTNRSAEIVSAVALNHNDFAMTLGRVTNESGTLISSGNYTSTSSGTVIATDAGATDLYNGTNWNVTYTYSFNAETAASNASGDLVTALAGGSAWITILVVVGFATIVLGMLTQGLQRKEDELESGYVY